MNTPHLVYLVTSVLIFVILASFIVTIAKGNSHVKKELLMPVSVGLFTIPCYTVFILTDNHFMAMLFNSIYYACTDWLAFFMLCLVVAITGSRIRFKHLKKIICSFLVLDSISMILNCWFNHTYDVVWAEWYNGWYYWKLDFYPLHNLHLLFCYVFVLATFVILIKEIVTMPSMYKTRYIAIMVMYLIVIIANMVCYRINLPVDVSIVLYALLTAFVCYYSNFLIPRALVAYSLRNFNHSIDDAIICFDINNLCLYSNPAAERLFGEDGVFNPREAELFRKRITEKFGGVEQFISDDEVFKLESGEVHCSVEYQQLKLKTSVIGSYLKIQDRTEELNLLFRERYTSTHDSLTGIYNRGYFFEKCDKRIKENPDVPMVMIASNIRDFKLINAMFGTRKGDEVLCREAELLRALSHVNNVYGRINDDKFAVMMRAEDFCLDYFIQGVNELEKLIQSSTYHTRGSLGICEFKGTEESASVLYDKALLVLKSLSDDYQQIYAYYDDSLMNRLLQEKSVASDFEKALEEKQFEIILDTIVDKTAKPFGAIASVRWNHPEKGILRPEFFIPTLEKTGSMYKLDLYIWEHVIACLKGWCIRGIKNYSPLAIKVSESDFYYLDVADEIISLVKKYEINPGLLVVDISESIISRQYKNAKECVTKLRAEGIQVSVVDFGRDITSLKIIEKISASILTVDMNLLEDGDGGKRGKVILEFIIQMARTLGMYVIARGVKTEAQYKMLIDMGFDYFQRSEGFTTFSIKDYENKYLNFAD